MATYRSDELHRRHPLRPFLAELDRLPQAAHIEVPRLDRDVVAELLGSLLASAPDASVIDEIYSRSDGIPFFVEELAGTDCCDLPSGLRNVLIIRFEALSPPAQATVRLVALAGNQAEHELIAAVSEQRGGDLDVSIREAVDGQLLIADATGYHFRHALLREAILDDLLPGEAMALHRRFAETLEARTDLDPGTRAVSSPITGTRPTTSPRPSCGHARRRCCRAAAGASRCACTSGRSSCGHRYPMPRPSPGGTSISSRWRATSPGMPASSSGRFRCTRRR